jgi:hypothetical protein
MRTVLALVEKAGGWRAGLWLRISNQPYMELVIEALSEPGPCGFPVLSVAHYGEQNGDAMRDPEMLFELEPGGSLSPYYWRNDYAGVEQWSRTVEDGRFASHRALFLQHVFFAKLWDNNLQSQSYLEAFDPKQHTRG